MKITKVLHIISYFKWIFVLWMITLMVYIFVSDSENTINSVGTVMFLAGIMMGFSSLSNNSKLSEKEITLLANPKFAKRQLRILFSGVFLLILISILFHSV